MVRRVISLSKVIILLIPILLLSACGEEYCEEGTSGMPLVGIYALQTPPVEAKIDSLTVYGVDQVNDSILYNNVSRINSFYTPLNISAEEVKYVLLYESRLIGEPYKRDTLTYKYHKKLTFETPECGASYTFIIDEFKYTTHSIAYAELITPEVNSIESQTVKIYYVAED